MSATGHPPGSPQTTASFGYLLTDVLRLLRRDFHTRSRGLGLTPALARLLYYVYRRPGSRQADLAALLDVTPVTLGRMIDRLMRQHYVRREADQNDRRVIRIYVDLQGEPVVTKMAQISVLTQNRAMASLSTEQREQLHSLLAHIQLNLTGPL